MRYEYRLTKYDRKLHDFMAHIVEMRGPHLLTLVANSPVAFLR